jgi:hypothetical protein
VLSWVAPSLERYSGAVPGLGRQQFYCYLSIRCS